MRGIFNITWPLFRDTSEGFLQISKDPSLCLGRTDIFCSLFPFTVSSVCYIDRVTTLGVDLQNDCFICSWRAQKQVEQLQLSPVAERLVTFPCSPWLGWVLHCERWGWGGRCEGWQVPDCMNGSWKPKSGLLYHLLAFSTDSQPGWRNRKENAAKLLSLLFSTLTRGLHQDTQPAELCCLEVTTFCL